MDRNPTPIVPRCCYGGALWSMFSSVAACLRFEESRTQRPKLGFGYCEPRRPCEETEARCADARLLSLPGPKILHSGRPGTVSPGACPSVLTSTHYVHEGSTIVEGHVVPRGEKLKSLRSRWTFDFMPRIPVYVRSRLIAPEATRGSSGSSSHGCI